MSDVGVGAQIEEAIKLARAVLAGRPKSTVHSSIKVDGLLVDVNISVPPTLVPPTLMQRMFRRLRKPHTWPSYAISVSGRIARRLGLRI